MSFVSCIETLNDDLVNECWDWARGADSISGDYYEEVRGQGNSGARQEQFFHGKLGEFAIFQYLLKKGYSDVTKPELTVRRPTYHDPDLICPSKNLFFHVKTCAKIRDGSRSWVFEKKNHLTHNPNDNDIICLCSLLEVNKIRIDAMRKAIKFQGKFKEMIIKTLTSKCAIYGRDFPEIHKLDFPEDTKEDNLILGF